MVGNATGTGVSGGTSVDTDSQIQESRNRRSSAERQAMIADAKASAQRASGNAANAQGSAQSAMGAVSMGIGGAQAITGGVLSKVGYGMLSNPATNATGWTLIVAGVGMLIGGLGQIATGVMQMSAGNQKIAEGTSQLAQAAQNKIISNEQAGVANKEMIRSQIFESKKAMLDATLKTLSEENKLNGSDGMDLTQDQLDKLQSQGAEMFDKAFKAGADALKNGGELGIMTLEVDGEDRYFINDNDLGITEVNILKNEDGSAKLDQYGRMQIDTDNEVTGKSALSEDKELELIFNFAIMNQMKDMITGHKGDPNASPPTKDVPPLARIEIDPATGEAKKGDYNLSNPLHMREFADLVDAAFKNPPPLKFIEDTETKELYFQKWNWDTDEAAGDKVSLKEMTGANISRSDADWLTKAKESASAAFTKAGLGEDSDIYQLLKPLVAESASNDRTRVSLDEYKEQWSNYRPSALNQRSSFGNNSNRISLG